MPCTPQQNGQAEHFNHTILEKAEAMHQTACLPPSFWQDTVEIALHIYNHQSMCCLDWLPPISKWNGETPDVSYFKVFGCLTYVFIPKEDCQNKLLAKAKEATFIGYKKGTKEYCFWSPKHRQVVISSTATFDEFVFPHCSRKTDDKPPPIPQGNKDEVNQEPLQDPKPQEDILVTQYYSFPPMED